MMTRPSLRATLRAMEPGTTEDFPVAVTSSASLRNCASILSFELLRKYSVNLDREAGMYHVTRTQ